MNTLKMLALPLLLTGTLVAAATETALYNPQASLLAPPPGQESVGDGHGDIAVAANGNIYLSVQGWDLSGVQVYDASGAYLHNLRVTAPHGVAFDDEGNILVTEWNRWGRVLTFSRAN